MDEDALLKIFVHKEDDLGPSNEGDNRSISRTLRQW